MKLGISSYSLHRALEDGRMDIADVIRWVGEQGGEHIEVVPIGFDLIQNPELIPVIKHTAQSVGIELSNYVVGGNFITETEQQYEDMLAKTIKHVDIARELGVKFMRHDVASRPIAKTTLQQFEADLPRLVRACCYIADYAAPFGITTSVENHGYYVQAADRVQRLVNEVDRPNFKTTLDIGNFMCVDENPAVSVRNNIHIASVIHIKDFYHRPSYHNPGEGWFTTAGGNYLRGAIIGHGDIDIRHIVSMIKKSGFHNYISIEFEGMEDCLLGTRISMDNVRRLWAEID